MAVDIYLRTPAANGDVVVKGYEGWSAALAWSWGIATAVNFSGAGGAEVGKPSVSALNVSKWADQASVNLGSWLVQGTPMTYDLAAVTATQAGPLETFKIRMFDTYVESLSMSGSSGDDRQVENVSLVFKRFLATVTTLDAKGSPTSRSWKYDQVTGT